MFGRRIHLFTILGFRIGLDPSWFIIAILVTWTLAQGYFPMVYEGLSTESYWWMGVAGALGLFASIILHELGHAVAARNFGIEMRGITLFIFGGVAEMEDEPPSPKAEFVVAVAGPLASIGVAAACYGLSAAGRVLGWPVTIHGVTSYLALINVILVIFNMVPAFPLDGGRVLRSAVWYWKDSLRQATRITAGIGAGFGVVLIVLGVFTVVLGNFIAGLWWLLIGLFLRHAAQMSYQQLLLRKALEGETVARFMHPDPVTVPRSLPVSELVDRYVYRHHHKMFPVMDDGRLYGCVTTRKIRELPRGEWPTQTVGAIAEPCGEQNTIPEDTDAMKALARMSREGVSRLMVTDDRGQLVGVIALKDLLRFFNLKLELEAEDKAA